MDLSLVLEMAAGAFPDRVLLQAGDRRLTGAELDRLASDAAARFLAAGADSVVYLGTSDPAYAVCLFGAARAGLPVIPLNYRASAEQIAHLLAAHPKALVVTGGVPGLRLTVPVLDRDELLAPAASAEAVVPPGDTDATAVLLYTSGTSAAPKAAVLRHRHLTAYLMTAVEFGAAEESDAALVTVPPYHVAGLTNLLSNIWAGRRLVYLEAFDPQTWLETVRNEGITQAMVVPTMLARIVTQLGDARDAGTPTLRTLSYGGSRMPLPVLERALQLFPETGFVNAYGLTETSSTIALLGPEEHRVAVASDDPSVRARLTSAGQLVPGIEVELRSAEGEVLPTGARGLLFLRGEQVSGEYAGGSALDAGGWFDTRDSGWIDADGYLFIEGRADDTIIRGGENIAPAEIEDVLAAHPAVVDVVVVGVPDETWGQRIEAVVVVSAAVSEDEMRDFVRSRLRSSKTPDRVHVRADLPRTDTGKVLRRVVLAQLDVTPANAGSRRAQPNNPEVAMTEAVIVSACRTAVGTARRGALSETSAFDLAHAVLVESLQRSGLDPAEVDDVVLGESLYGGGDIARHAAITAGMTTVPGLALNRHCATGLSAVSVAAGSIRAGMDRVVIAGGTNSSSTSPQTLWRTPGTQDWLPGMSPSHPESADAPNMDMSISVGWNTVKAAGLTREDQDAWALESHRKAISAIDEGRFTEEIVPIKVTTRDGSVQLFDTDEHPRRDSSMEKLSSLKVLHPEIEGFSITAGNAGGINDAAAAVTVVADDVAAARGLSPLAVVRSWASVGVEPRDMGLAPQVVIPKALDRAGLTLADVDLFEINEAFASVPVAACRALGIDPAIVNPNGSGCSIGHPIAASGTRMIVTLIHELRRRGGGIAVAAMCAGGGMGGAVVLEVPSA